MLDDKQLEVAIRDLLLDLCEVMSRRGYEMVNVGAMMRLVGVSEERAAQHDSEYFALDENFQEMLKQRDQAKSKKKTNNKKDHGAANGATIH